MQRFDFEENSLKNTSFNFYSLGEHRYTVAKTEDELQSVVKTLEILSIPYITEEITGVFRWKVSLK